MGACAAGAQLQRSLELLERIPLLTLNGHDHCSAAVGACEAGGQLHCALEFLRPGPLSEGTGTLGGDAAAYSEARRDQLQRHNERLREGAPVAILAQAIEAQAILAQAQAVWGRAWSPVAATE